MSTAATATAAAPPAPPAAGAAATAAAATTHTPPITTPTTARARRGAPRINQYELDIEIGRGGFGKVHLATDTTTGRRVAIKVVSKEMLKQTDTESYFLREAAMSQQLSHPNIVKAIEFIDYVNVYALVLELAPNGELFDKIIEHQRFDEVTARRYFQQLVSAVAYLHSNNVVHRDLKAENMLVGVHGELKLCDFGLARYTDHAAAIASGSTPECRALATGRTPTAGYHGQYHDGKQIKTPVDTNVGADDRVMFMSLAGSPDYVAPEVIAPNGYSGHGCDIWSMGVILFFMVCGYLPFASNAKNERDRQKETQSKIAKGEFNAGSRYLTSGTSDLLKKMLVVDPAKRFTISDVADHEWTQTDLDPTLAEQIANYTSALGSCTGKARVAHHPSATTKAKEITVDADVLRFMTKAFKACNASNNGMLSRTEVRDVLIKLNHGNPVPDEEVQQFIDCFDLDGTDINAGGGIDKNNHSMNNNSTTTTSNNNQHGGNGENSLASSTNASPSLGSPVRYSPSVHISEKQFMDGWAKLGPYLAAKGVPIERLADMFHYDLESKLIEELRDAFADLDVDQAGVISVEALMKIPKLQLTREQAEQLLKAVDVDHTKTITFENFVHAVTKSDVLHSHPICSRLQRLDKLFHIVEQKNAAGAATSGFTVAGFRMQIFKKLRAEAHKIRAKFQDPEGFENGGEACEANLNYISGEVLGPDGAARLLVGIRLQPSVPGFTRLVVYRIMGKTLEFHGWFRELRGLLHDEIIKVVEDTAVVGESELM